MALNDIAHGAVNKKTVLMEKNFARYAVRSILAGVYLTLATGFAGVSGHAVEQLAPGLGSIVFALLFGLGIFAIIILNAELATGNMMFASYGAVSKQISWGKAGLIIVVSTVFNLVGALLIGFMLSNTAIFSDVGPDHLINSLSEGKLQKPWWELLISGMMANFVVNMGVVGSLFAKDITSKFFVLVPMIAIFVGLSLEHIIANFSLMSITMFSSDPMIDSMNIGSVALNWILVWIGNIIGGGLLMGGVYAWLNRGDEVYRD